MNRPAHILRQALLQQREAQRINEVSRVALSMQRATPGLPRTEALRVAERLVPQS